MITPQQAYEQGLTESANPHDPDDDGHTDWYHEYKRLLRKYGAKSVLQKLEHANVVYFEKEEDGVFVIENCDWFFRVLLTKEDLIELRGVIDGWINEL